MSKSRFPPVRGDVTLVLNWDSIEEKVTLTIQVTGDIRFVNFVIQDTWTKMTYIATYAEIISIVTFVMGMDAIMSV